MRGRFIGFVGLLALALGAGTAFAHGAEHGGAPKEPQKKRGRGEEPGHSHERASVHGGEVTMTKEFHFEVVFEAERIAVYPYSGAQDPISAKGLGGSVEVRFRGDKPVLKAPLTFRDDGKQGYLEAALDLSGIKPGEAKATIQLGGLAGEGEKEVSFIQPVRLSAGRSHDDGHQEKSSHHH